MTTRLEGPVGWKMTRDDEGHRTYTIEHLVISDDQEDGPTVVINTPGLPVIGSVWNFFNDFDPWAFCWPTMDISPKESEEPYHHFIVRQIFTTKPLFRCQDQSIEDPTMEPDRLSGSFVKYVREITSDRNGNPVRNSAFEQLRGPQVEFDANRPTVRIEQNRANLELETFSQMIDTLNDSTLWGLPARTIKLSNVSWQRKLYGTCTYYYTRVLDFDIDFNTFDRSVIDEGTKVLHGHWDPTTGDWTLDNIGGSPPSKDDPRHFDLYQDKNGNPAKVVLNGNGEPWDGTGTDGPGMIDIEYYGESNFLLLGIPTVLG